MKKVNAPPGATRLIESLRNLGYDCSTAIADLVDNSIAAQASDVHVDIFAQQGTRPPHIVIADNGHGMDRDALHEAMRFGALQDYSIGDLGKYGLGLKTASLSQCRILTVASKAHSSQGKRPRRHILRWDLDHVHETDDWELLAPTESELLPWERDALANPLARTSGTVVMWSGLDEALPILASDNIRQRERFLARSIKDISEHLRMVFHRFMQGSVVGRKALTISVCGQTLTPWDPFCRSESTRQLDIARETIDGTNRSGQPSRGWVTISPYVLPREDEFSSSERWKEAAGPKNWNPQQGFYFYRNDRLLQAGGWSHIRSVDEHLKLLRIAVDFNGALDQSFSLNVTKMRAKIPAEIRESVSSAVSKWAKVARERYDHRSSQHSSSLSAPEPSADRPPRRNAPPPRITVGRLSLALSNVPTPYLSVSPGSQAGTVSIVVPQGHELAQMFSSRGSLEEGRDPKRLCAVALAVLEAVFEGRMRPEDIPLSSLRRAFNRVR